MIQCDCGWTVKVAKCVSPFMALKRLQTLLTGFPNWDVSRVLCLRLVHAVNINDIFHYQQDRSKRHNGVRYTGWNTHGYRLNFNFSTTHADDIVARVFCEVQQCYWSVIDNAKWTRMTTRSAEDYRAGMFLGTGTLHIFGWRPWLNILTLKTKPTTSMFIYAIRSQYQSLLHSVSSSNPHWQALTWQMC